MTHKERTLKSLHNAFKRTIMLPEIPVDVVQIAATRMLNGLPESGDKDDAIYVLRLLQNNRYNAQLTMVLNDLYMVLTLTKASYLSTITRYVIDLNRSVRDYLFVRNYLYQNNNPDFQ